MKHFYYVTDRIRLLAVVMLLVVSCGVLHAEKVTINGFTYEIDVNNIDITNRVASVVGLNETYTGAGIPSTITYNGITYSVTSIGEKAFFSHESLTSITIPASVVEIRDKAFNFCTSLKTVRFEDGDKELILGSSNEQSNLGLFDHCPLEKIYLGRTLSYKLSPFKGQEKLTSLTIGDYVTTLGESAFNGCSSLTRVQIPNSVTTVGNYAFNGCSSLNGLRIGDSVTSIGESAFAGCSSLISFYIPDGVISIGSSAFNGCTSMTGVRMPDSVTTLGDNVFKGCTALNSVTIGSSVTSIGVSVFKGCTSLTSVKIPDSVTSVGDNAFNGCKVLNSATIGSSVTSIGASAFNGCSSLTSVKIPDSVTSVGDNAFNGCAALNSVTIGSSVTCIGESAFNGCSSLTSINIPDAVTSIGASAFNGCSSLTSVKIPDSVTSLNDNVLNGCKSLNSVIIGNYVTSIGTSSFNGCSSLTAINIPDAVISIGRFAFSGCSSLTSIKIPDAVTSVGDAAFSGCSSLTSMTIPSSVTEIGSNAFNSCAAITELTLEDGEQILSMGKQSEGEKEYGLFHDCPLLKVYLGRTLSYKWSPFEGQEKLTSVTIGSYVTSLGASAFSGCSSLTSLTIPSSVTEIGDNAFNGCVAITKVTLEDGEQELSMGHQSDGENEYGLFHDCPLLKVYLGRTLSHKWSPFEGQEKLTSVTIGSYVTSLGVSAFSGCSSITAINIPDAVNSIGSSAFSGCSFASVTIPKSVVSIGNDVFNGCDSLKELIMEDGEQNLYVGYKYDGRFKYGLFSDCPLEKIYLGRTLFYSNSPFEYKEKLSSVTIGSYVTSLGELEFYYCSSLASIAIPASVIEIGKNAFLGCESIKELTLEDGEQILELKADYNNFHRGPFSDCPIEKVYLGRTLSHRLFTSTENSKIISVTIGDYVTSIGKKLFSGYGSLKYVTIGSSVTSISEDAFYGCGLREVEVLALEPPKCSNMVFSEKAYSSALLRVPENSVELYKKADTWKNFLRIISIDDVEATSVSLNIGTVELEVDDCVQLTATVAPDDATDQSVIWSTSDALIATVDADGKVTAVKAGEAIITATAANGLTATCKVTVKANASSSIDVVTDDGIAVGTEGGDIIVYAPEGSVVEVFAITGVRMRHTVGHRISELSNGMYIVRVAGRVFKVRL